MMIGIGSVEGGPELVDTAFATSLGAIAGLLSARGRESKLAASPVLNPVFHAPGSIVGAGFEGVRTAKFSRHKKILMVQIAVPEEAAAATDPSEFIFKSIREAIRIARPVFEQARIDFDEDEFLD
ncbi:MAG: hypothetical protein GY842_18320, partial [bacterium]|nr:hypothetical protein [bacterium]